MNYRIVQGSRMEQVQSLWDYCFDKKETPFFQYYFNEYCGKDNTVIGGFEEINGWERLRSMLHLNPYMLRIRGQEQLVPYIVGVATAPETRGRHLFAPLLSTSFDVLRDQGFTFVTLMPISASIYLPYGFSYYSYRHAYKLPMAELWSQLTKEGADLKVEREALSKELLAPLYAELTAELSGVPKRTDFQWHKLLTVHNGEGMRCAVVCEAEQPAGYMLYHITDGIFTVHELLARTQASKNRLLRFAAQHISEAKEFSWLAEAWDKTYLSFGKQEYSGSLQPFMMARCLDMRKALVNLDVPEGVGEGSVVLLLTDDFIDRNNHLVELSTQQGSRKTRVVSTAADEDVTMDVAAFTQLYMGAFSAMELHEAGRIKCADMTKLAYLDKLLPRCRTYNNEYF